MTGTQNSCVKSFDPVQICGKVLIRHEVEVDQNLCRKPGLDQNFCRWATPVPMTLLQVQYIEQGESVYKVLVPKIIQSGESIAPDDDFKSINPIICQVQNAQDFQDLCLLDKTEKPSITSFIDLSNRFKTVKSLVKLRIRPDSQGKKQVVPDKRSLLSVDVSGKAKEVIELLSPETSNDITVISPTIRQKTIRQNLSPVSTSILGLSSRSSIDKEPKSPEVIELLSSPRRDATSSKQGIPSHSKIAGTLDSYVNKLSNPSKAPTLTVKDPPPFNITKWNNFIQKMQTPESSEKHNIIQSSSFFKENNVSSKIPSNSRIEINAKAQPNVTVEQLMEHQEEVICDSMESNDSPMFTIGPVWSLTEEQEAVLNIPISLPSIESEAMVPIPNVYRLEPSTQGKVSNNISKYLNLQPLVYDQQNILSTKAVELPYSTAINVNPRNVRPQEIANAIVIESMSTTMPAIMKPVSSENLLPVCTVSSTSIVGMPESNNTITSTTRIIPQSQRPVLQKGIEGGWSKVSNIVVSDKNKPKRKFPKSPPTTVNLAVNTSKTYTRDVSINTTNVKDKIEDSKWESVLKKTNELTQILNLNRRGRPPSSISGQEQKNLNPNFTSEENVLKQTNGLTQILKISRRGHPTSFVSGQEQKNITPHFTPEFANALNKCMQSSLRTNIAVVAPFPSDQNIDRVQNVKLKYASEPVGKFVQDEQKNEKDTKQVPKHAISIVDKIANILSADFDVELIASTTLEELNINKTKPEKNTISPSSFRSDVDAQRSFVLHQDRSHNALADKARMSATLPNQLCKDVNDIGTRTFNFPTNISRHQPRIGSLTKSDKDLSNPRTLNVVLKTAEVETERSRIPVETCCTNYKDRNVIISTPVSSPKSSSIINVSDISSNAEKLNMSTYILDKEIKQEAISNYENEISIESPHQEFNQITSHLSTNLQKVIATNEKLISIAPPHREFNQMTSNLSSNLQKVISNNDKEIRLDTPQQEFNKFTSYLSTSSQKVTSMNNKEINKEPQRRLNLLASNRPLKTSIVDTSLNDSFKKWKDGINAERVADKPTSNPFPNWNPNSISSFDSQPVSNWDPQFVIKKENEYEEKRGNSSSTTSSENESSTSSTDDECKQMEMKLTIARLKSRTSRSKLKTPSLNFVNYESSDSSNSSDDENFVAPLASKGSKILRSRSPKGNSSLSPESKNSKESMLVTKSVSHRISLPQNKSLQNIETKGISEPNTSSFQITQAQKLSPESTKSQVKPIKLKFSSHGWSNQTKPLARLATTKRVDYETKSVQSPISLPDSSLSTCSSSNRATPVKKPEISVSKPIKYNSSSFINKTRVERPETKLTTPVKKLDILESKLVKRSCSSSVNKTLERPQTKRTYSATISCKSKSNVIDLQVVKPCFVRLERLNGTPTVTSSSNTRSSPELPATRPLRSTKRNRKRKMKSQLRYPKLAKEAKIENPSENSPPTKCIVFSPESSSIEGNERSYEEHIESEVEQETMPMNDKDYEAKFKRLRNLLAEKYKLLETYRKKFGAP